MRLTPRGVVLDFGNVLYHVDYPAMGRRLAGDRAQEFLRRFAGSRLQIAFETGRVDLAGVLQTLAAEGFDVGRSAFLAAYLSIFAPVPGMRDLVRRLAGRFRLGLLSNTSAVHASQFIERVPEFQCFDARVYSFELGSMKPEPELYREIARRLSLTPSEIVYVDDIEPYARGAEGVGMWGITFQGARDLRRRLSSLGIEVGEPQSA